MEGEVSLLLAERYRWNKCKREEEEEDEDKEGKREVIYIRVPGRVVILIQSRITPGLAAGRRR